MFIRNQWLENCYQPIPRFVRNIGLCASLCTAYKPWELVNIYYLNLWT